MHQKGSLKTQITSLKVGRDPISWHRMFVNENHIFSFDSHICLVCTKNLGRKRAAEMLSHNLRKFKLVTFDCTNTLLYFKRLPSEVYLQTAVDMGHKRESFDRNIINTGFREHFKEMAKNFPNFGSGTIGYVSWWTNVVQNVLREASHNKINPQEFIKVADKLIDLYETNEVWGKFRRSNDLVEAIRRDKKIVGVISNFDPRLPNILRRMGLYNFDFIINSYEARCEKPDRSIFNQAIDRAAGFNFGLIYPGEALHIGNERDKDYEGALEAGWSSILLNSENKQGDVPCFKDIDELWIKLHNEELNL